MLCLARWMAESRGNPLWDAFGAALSVLACLKRSVDRHCYYINGEVPVSVRWTEISTAASCQTHAVQQRVFHIQD
jgi:hypothetical protein